ncbi:MAG: hypothetical protein CVV25_04030 [Ignavibacteriae bacterium HGW-Ignavibacteriae-4]|jgi:hypothetical protein|nr:MAG: hypothetical protein CVV25_04030 [Ignavibacteriae bacterium HGW-Ignavibacteriae-4]
MKKYVIFLDILGFTKYIETDPAAASQLLFDVSNLLNLQNNDNRFKGKISSKFLTTGFSDFLLSSDSVIASSNDINIMLPQLSKFLKSCINISIEDTSFSHYAIANSIYKSPVEMELKDIDGKTRTVKNYPLLFRGGGYYGEFNSIKVNSLFQSNLMTTFNFYGNGFIKAYYIERSGFKGPRLMLSEDFYLAAEQRLKHLFLKQPNDNLYEFLWFYIIYIEGNEAGDEISKVNEYLPAAIRLWEHYNLEMRNEIDNEEKEKKKSVVIQYYEFICLIIKSTITHFHHIWKEDGQHIAINYIDNLIKDKEFYPEVKVLINETRV